MQLIDIKSNHKPLYVFMMSAVFALYANTKCINTIISSYTNTEPLEGGFMTQLYISVVSLAVLFSFLYHGLKKRKLFNMSMIIALYCCAFYWLTVLLTDTPTVPFVQVLVFSVASLLLPSLLVIDVRIVLKLIMLTAALGIFNATRIFVYEAAWHEFISMGVSYSFMLPVLTTIVYMNVYFKDEKRIKKIITIILLLINAYYFFVLISLGSRGPVVVALMLFLFVWVVRSKNRGITIRKKRFQQALIIMATVLILFIPILKGIDKILDNFGLNLRFVDKFLLLGDEGNISHGRDFLYNLTLQGIKQSPIFGQGFDLFLTKTGYIYPHNSLLQILYDGGLVLFSLIFIPVFYNCRRIIKTCTKDEYALFILFLFAGLVGSMFSGNLWKTPLFWLFLGIVLSHGQSKTTVKKEVMKRNMNHNNNSYE